jgi:hypothetical protein
MIHSFTVTFGAKYLTGMVTSVPQYKTFSLIKNNILHQSKNYKNNFENSNFYVILRTDMSIFKPAFAVVGGAYHQITRGIV